MLARGFMLGSTAIRTTLDPTSAPGAGVIFSNNNLTFRTAGTSTGARNALGSTGKTAGKFYFEVTFDALATPGFPLPGVSSSTGYGNATSADSMGAAAVIASGGNIYSGGTFVATSGVTFAAGDKLQVAVDLTNGKVWFRKIGAANWNAGGGADPATNVGGVTLPAGTIYPLGSLNDNSTAGGHQLTFNFGQNAFAGTIPSGFQPWG